MSYTRKLPGLFYDKGVEVYNVLHPDFGLTEPATTCTGAMTATDATFTATAAVFTAADVGKIMYVPGAGASGLDLYTTIASFTSTTVVELTDAASTTVASAAAAFGEDFTDQAQAAMDAATDAGGGRVYFPPGIYFVVGTDQGTYRSGLLVNGDNLTVEGAGPASILRAGQGADPQYITKHGTENLLSDITFRDLRLENNDVLSFLGGYGAVLYRFERFTCERVQFINCSSGAAQGALGLSESRDFLAINCEVDGRNVIAATGFKPGSNCVGFRVCWSRFARCARPFTLEIAPVTTGLYYKDCDFSHNYVHLGDVSSVSATNTFIGAHAGTNNEEQSIEGLTIAFNAFDSNTGGTGASAFAIGLFGQYDAVNDLNSIRDVTIHGNKVRDFTGGTSTSAAIDLTNVDDADVRGNVLGNPTALVSRGIRLRDSRYCVVEGNRIKGANWTYGIYEDTPSRALHNRFGLNISDPQIAFVDPEGDTSKSRVVGQYGTTKEAVVVGQPNSLTYFTNGAQKVGDGAWNGAPLLLGTKYLWVDSSNRLRIKSTAPSSDTDGTIVGTQS